MNYILIVFLLIYSMGNSVFAQSGFPVIKASSPKVAIKDGSEAVTKYWNHLVKGRFPVLYDLAKNQANRKVTFCTDIDSISFSVFPNSTYLFNVLLNEKDTCSVILSTAIPNFSRLDTSNTDIISIPFEINKNKQIIVRGSVNKSPEIEFVFDLGARITYLIGADLAERNNLILDGKMEDESVSGLATESTSSKNTLEFSNIQIENTPVCYIDEKGFLDDGGGLIGFNIFQGKVLEIDFDNQLLLVHNSVSDKANEYSAVEFKQTTGGMYIPVALNNGKKETFGLYFFDTGANFGLSIDSRFASKENLYDTMEKIGTMSIASSEEKVLQVDNLLAPKISIAGFQFEDVPVLLGKDSFAESAIEDGVIGIELQKRFNYIIDYPNSIMYLKPNKYFSDSFRKKK